MSRCTSVLTVILVTASCLSASTVAHAATRTAAHAGGPTGFAVGGVTLPVGRLPARVLQNPGSGRGILTLTFPSYGLRVATSFVNHSRAVVGTVTKSSTHLVFVFTHLSYTVAPFLLPTGARIGQQTLRLDPSTTSTLRVDLRTGAITRNFHWKLSGGNALYNGSPSVALADHGKSTVQRMSARGSKRYSITIRTKWKSRVALTSFRVGGRSQPAGIVNAHAQFTGTYVLVLSK
ncbi:MAG: hypothetical protein NVSMB52_02500 [Chloroflexota bacterium]